MDVRFVVFFSAVFLINFCSAQFGLGKLTAIADGIENDKENVKESVTDVQIKVKKADRTTYKLNGTLELLQDLPADTMFHAYIQKQRGPGRYEKFMGIEVVKNLCEFMKNDKEYYPQVKKSGTLPDNCPFAKGTYLINDAAIKLENIPDILQPGCYKLFLQFVTAGGKTISSTVARCRVTAKGDGSDSGKCSK